ncbi:transporter substrate-binding domain-containing protein [Exilibacterium tricleocarpae]|uniref:Transporter substrate-binding domain-containing protein n=1 Tax=Exilibacterium tricleocarpae TaxID=2591008 RepID=A0A545TSB7_9GAMM|nr:transporter substrate-binding domain-containing protein [Exilibacterium tricleocarpae]TQV80118.1 transporter substrate-binding domain-containing protein [Exilibacterium tricleocarpae]
MSLAFTSRRNARIAAVCAGVLISFCLSRAVAEERYRTGYPHLPPLNYYEDGEVKGIVAGLFVDVMTEAGIDYEARQYPTKRFYHNIASGNIQIGLFSRAVPVYRDKVIFARQPAVQVQGRIYWRNGKAAIGTIRDLKNKRVAVFLGLAYGGYDDYVTNPEHGNQVITVKTADQAMHLLASGRVDYFLGLTVVTDRPVQRHAIESLDSVQFFQAELFFTVHKSVPGAERLLQRMVAAHQRLVERGEVDRGIRSKRSRSAVAGGSS